MSTPTPIPVQPSLIQPLPGGTSNKLEVPQLGGSPVGFWVLIVSLALIVIICCIAIFWLLKHHEPTPAERARRRAKRDAEKASAEAVSTDEHSPDPRSFKERIGRFFGKNGWTKANDDIEIHRTPSDSPYWKSEGDKEDDDSPYVATTRSGYGGVPNDQHEYHRDSRMSSTSTVQLSPPSPEHTPIISRGVDLPFEPPYRSISPQPELDSPSPESSPTRGEPRRDERSFSVLSGDHTAPMKKFVNGTKFMEGI